MPRTQTNQPLANAAPALQPTARPLAIPLGATPPPTRSPIAELGESFKDFMPELRTMLRDTAAREEQDAQSIGEIESTKARAEGRLAEIDGILKQKVDAGELASRHLPAAQRGASLRSGVEAAEVGFQTEILSGLQDAIKGGPSATNKVIADNLKKYADAIPATDFYARKGFDHASKGIIESFRQRAAEGQAIEFDRVHKEGLANAGAELALRLATADDEASPVAHSDFRNHIEQIRQELPKSNVNAFVVESIIAPAIAKLADERKFAEARQLLDESEKIDVTGKGGLLSQTTVAKGTFAQLRNLIEREAKADTHVALEAYKSDRELRSLKGADAAGAQLQKIRLDNNGALPQMGTRLKLIDQFRKGNAGDPVLVAAFADAVNSEYEQEDKFRADERTVSDLVLQTNTLDKAKLEQLGSTIEAQYKAGAVPASARSQLLEVIAKRKALAGFVDESDFRAFKRNVFAVPQGSFEPTVNFGGQVGSEEWDKLNSTSQANVELATTAYFREQLEQNIIRESKDDPNQVPAIKAIALDKATLAAREFAKANVAKAVVGERNLTTKAVIAAQSKAVNNASFARSIVPSLQYAALTKVKVPSDDVPGEAPPKDRTEVILKTYAPKVANKSDLALNFKNLPADSDVAEYRAPGDILSKFIDLNALGKDATTSPDKYIKSTAKAAYGYAKAGLGFSPEEIQAATTKHGVPFNPGEIDPSHIRVFRSVAELNKHWNNGQPDEVFVAVGDAVDPNDKLTPRAFYLAQRALLKGK